MKSYDLVIKNVRVVRPGASAVEDADIAIAKGKFSRIERNIDPSSAKAVYDGKGRLAFPGVVDAHMHAGIYSPLKEDAVSESRAAAQGGVTSMLNYFRTGQYYLNKGGPYRNPRQDRTSSLILTHGLASRTLFGTLRRHQKNARVETVYSFFTTPIARTVNK